MFRTLVLALVVSLGSALHASAQPKFTPPEVLVFPEGVINAPTQELAFLIVSSPETASQQVYVEFLANGRWEEWSGTVPAKAQGGRFVVALHDVLPPMFRTTGILTYSTHVHCEQRCAAQIVIRNSAKFWADPTIIDPQKLPYVP